MIAVGSQRMLPALILFLAYVVLALGHLPGLRLDRTGAAVIGAILMVTVGANLIVVEGARKRDVTITFGEYLRVGIPVTIATLAFGTWWVY